MITQIMRFSPLLAALATTAFAASDNKHEYRYGTISVQAVTPKRILVQGLKEFPCPSNDCNGTDPCEDLSPHEKCDLCDDKGYININGSYNNITNKKGESIYLRHEPVRTEISRLSDAEEKSDAENKHSKYSGPIICYETWNDNTEFEHFWTIQLIQKERIFKDIYYFIPNEIQRACPSCGSGGTRGKICGFGTRGHFTHDDHHAPPKWWCECCALKCEGCKGTGYKYVRPKVDVPTSRVGQWVMVNEWRAFLERQGPGQDGIDYNLSIFMKPNEGELSTPNFRQQKSAANYRSPIPLAFCCFACNPGCYKGGIDDGNHCICDGNHC